MLLKFSRSAPTSRGRVFAAALTAVVLGAGAAGAATVHRLAVSTTTGSEGAAATVQTSATGSALQGEVAASANTSLKLPFGVLGEYDHAGSTFGVGVAGVSTTGYGVGAESFGASPTMISLNESTGNGIEGYATGTSSDGNGMYAEAMGLGDGIDGYADKSGWGGYFASQTGIGVEGVSYGSTGTGAGVYGLSDGGDADAGYFLNTGSGSAIEAITDSTSSGDAVRGTNASGSVGILGDYTGEGLVAFGHSGGEHAAISGVDSVGNTDLLALFTYDGGTPHESFIVQANSANRSQDADPNGADVQTNGDLYVYGNVYENCQSFPATSSVDCQPVTGGTLSTSSRTSNGGSVEMYGSRQSLPTVEDEGTAELVNGKAYVRIDPAFARTMSLARPYRVFITPNGPSHGVHVANRSAQGFEVDENPGGRSTLDFDYRIVAAPFGDTSARLAVATRKPKPANVPDPAFAGLRAQSAATRAFDLARVQVRSRAQEAAHRKHAAPKPFVLPRTP